MNSKIVVEFVAHMYKDVSFVGQDYWMGAAFEMGSTQIWAAQLKFSGAAAIDPSGMASRHLYIFKYILYFRYILL